MGSLLQSSTMLWCQFILLMCFYEHFIWTQKDPLMNCYKSAPEKRTLTRRGWLRSPDDKLTRKFSRDTRHAMPRHSPLAPLFPRTRETEARFTSHMPRHSPTATKFSLPAFSGNMDFNQIPGVFRLVPVFRWF